LYKDLNESFCYLDGLVANGMVVQKNRTGFHHCTHLTGLLGTIGGYGICSNTMAFPQASDHVSLTEVIKSCSKLSNFVAAEVPFNLYERESIVSGENDTTKTVAEITKEHDIYLMTNRPLNAIANGSIRVLVNHELGANGKGPGKGV
jgi:hypothetical protein